MARTTRSLKTPITLTSVAVALSLGLLVGWSWLVVDTIGSGTTWLLVLGMLSIAFITTVLLLSGISLAREIVEGRRQRTFVDSVTHELKSPLASLRLCLETLSRTDLSDVQRVEVRQMMREDVDRLSTFIDGVLEASRLGHRRRDELRSRGPVAVGPLIEDAVTQALRRHPRVLATAVTQDVDPGLTVSVDAREVTTILQNLLDNALKYSDEEVAVTVQAVREGAMAVVRVRDRGIGLAEAEMDKIFRRFQRGDRDEVRERAGTGLGLHVAAELAAELGGRLTASSPGPGRGSTFTLSLPASAGPEVGAGAGGAR